MNNPGTSAAFMAAAMPGVRLVHTGASLACALDVHLHHLGPIHCERTGALPLGTAAPAQQAAHHRHRIMRKARSTKQRAALLAELERRYLNLD